MLVRFNKELLEIYVIAKYNQPWTVSEVTIRLLELRDQILSEHCSASLQAYNRYIQLISLYLPEVSSQLGASPEYQIDIISANRTLLPKQDIRSIINVKNITSSKNAFNRPNYLDTDWLESQLSCDPSRYDLVVWLARCRLRDGLFAEGRALLHRVATSHYREAILARYFLSRIIEEAIA